MANEMYPGCEICELLPNIQESMLLLENEDWNSNLEQQDQTLLGRSYITLKRHASELDELTADEERSFIDIRNKLLVALRASFRPITFNIMCLKNDAFKGDPDNTSSAAAHIHWHVIPRYGSRPVEFGDETFVDPFPGLYLNHTYERKRISPETAQAIAETIRSNLPE